MANTEGNVNFDCSLLNLAGTELGLKLVRKNNEPEYLEYGDNALSNQSYVGLPDYAHLPPDKELQIGSRDFRMGLGLERASGQPNEAFRYYRCVNADARFRGGLMPGPLPATVTKPDLPVAEITNGNMELDSDWTGGVRSDTQAHGGTYSMRVSSSNDSTHRIYQDISTYEPGVTYTFTGWVYGHASGPQLYIYDGTNYTYATAVTDASWNESTVTATLPLTATNLQVGIEFTKGGAAVAYAYMDDVSISMDCSLGILSAHCGMNDDEYISLGRCLTKLNRTDGGSLTKVQWFPYDVTALHEMSISGTDYLFISQSEGGVSYNPYYMSSTVLHTCEVVWDELIDGDVTESLEESDYKKGSGSLKLVVAAGCGAGDILATDVISETNLSTCNMVSAWIKSSVALDAGDLQILLDNTAECASPLESLDIPACAANTWTQVQIDLDDPSSDTAIVSVGIKMVVDKGAFTLYADAIESESFTESTVADNDAILYQKVTSSGTTNLWKSDGSNELRYTPDPLEGGDAWSTVKYCNSTAIDITGLDVVSISGEEALLVFKEDQPYYLDSNGSPQRLAPSLVTEKSTTSGKNSLVWQNRVYIPCGAQSLFEWNNGTLKNLSPSLFTTNDSMFDGQVQALASDSSYLYAFVDNGAKQELIAGSWALVNGFNDWYWNGSLAELTLAGVNTAFTSTVYKKRIWVGSTSASDDIYYIPLPTNYGNIANDSEMAFSTGGYLETSWEDANFAGDPKAWIKQRLTMNNVDATNFFTTYYQLWEDTTWTEIGDYGDDEETTHTEHIPADSGGNKPQSVMIRFKFEITSDGAAAAPQLLDWDCRGIWYPPKRKLIYLLAESAEFILKKEGTDTVTTEKDIRDFINDLYDPSTAWPASFHPPYWVNDDDTKGVKLVEPFSWKLKRIEQGPTNNKIYGKFLLTLEEVKLS